MESRLLYKTSSNPPEPVTREIYAYPRDRVIQSRIDLSSQHGNLTTNTMRYNINRHYNTTFERTNSVVSGGLLVPIRLFDGLPHEVLEMSINNLTHKYLVGEEFKTYNYAFFADPSRSPAGYIYYQPQFPCMDLGSVSMRDIGLSFNNLRFKTFELHAEPNGGNFYARDHGLQTGDIISLDGIREAIIVIDDDNFQADFPLIVSKFLIDSYMFKYHILVNSTE